MGDRRNFLELLDAVRQRKRRLVGRLILSADIYSRIRYHGVEYASALLSIAASLGDTVTVLTLLELGADPSGAPDDDGEEEAKFTPLHCACRAGHSEVVTILCRHASHYDLLHRVDNNRQTPLHTACSVRALDCMQILCKYGSNLDSTDKDNNTPLHLLFTSVAYVGEFCLKEGAIVLLKFGARVNAKGHNGETVLHIACKNGYVEIVKYLLKNGADVNQQDNNGRPPLHVAVESEKNEIVNILLDNGASVNICDRHVRSALHIAADKGYFEIAHALVRNGASVNQEDYDGWTPLLHATYSKHEPIVFFLLHNGASSSLRFTKNQISPLHVAASFGHMRFMQAFVKNGARVNEPAKFLRTPLHFASSFGSTSAVEFLLENRAIVNCPDRFGDTALHVSSQDGHLSVVGALVSKGAKIDAQNKMGKTPLHLATSKGNLGIVQFLLETGASVNMVDGNENSSLHLACSREIWKEPDDHDILRDKLSVLPVLVSKGALINVQNDKGSTPLHLASSLGSLRAVQLLLEAGALVNVVDLCGCSPLHCSRSNEISEVLLLHGSNVNLCNNFESTPLDDAIENGCSDVVKVLIRHGADVRIKNSEGENALLKAASSKQSDIIRDLSRLFLAKERDEALVYAHGSLEPIRVLIDLGANVNYVDSKGRTALFHASKHGSVDSVEFLLSKGAEIDAVDVKGKTPIMLAAKAGHGYVVQVLLKSGANVHAIDSKGGSALTYACAEGHVFVVRLLVEYEAGAVVRCPHKDMPLVKCLYVQYCHDMSMVRTFEQIMIRMFEANLKIEAYQETSLLEHLPEKWRSTINSRTSLKCACQNELHKLASPWNTFPGTGIPYIKALAQDPVALAHPDMPNLLLPKHARFWETLEKEYPVYGSLIRIRLQIGVERKALIQQSLDFFYFLGVNAYAAEVICSYMTNYDLRTISSLILHDAPANAETTGPPPPGVDIHSPPSM